MKVIKYLRKLGCWINGHVFYQVCEENCEKVKCKNCKNCKEWLDAEDIYGRWI